MSVINSHTSSEFHRSKSDIGTKKTLDDAKTMKRTKSFVKENSQSTLQDYLKQSQQINVDKDVWNKRKSVVTVRSGEILPESSNGNSLKVRVSSGSFFYGQVVAQQQLQATRNSTKNARPFENVGPDIKTQLSFSYARKLRDYLEMSIQQVIFLVFVCQVCASLYLYYLIITLKSQVRV